MTDKPGNLNYELTKWASHVHFHSEGLWGDPLQVGVFIEPRETEVLDYIYK